MASIPARIALSALLVLAATSPASALTVGLADGGRVFVAEGAEWRYFRGRSTPAPDWTAHDFDDSSWELGPSGFGYDDGDDATVLSDMEDNYRTVYIRRRFNATPVPAGDLVLEVDYDDGFIAYLNGVEVVRANMPPGAVDHETSAAGNHEAGSPEAFNLGPAAGLLGDGENMLAIEGHNVSLGSSDFSLIPTLGAGGSGAAVRDGEIWIVTTPTVALTGSTEAADAVEILVAGAAAAFDRDTGAWEAEAALSPGRNSIDVEARNASGTVVDSGSLVLEYVPSTSRSSGTLGEDTLWSGTWVVEETVTVPDGVRLSVAPGTTVRLQEDAALLVSGELRAVGTEEEPIRFTRFGEGSRWERILFREAADSVFEHCVFEYSDSEGEHQDYYEPGPRDYHETIVALATHLDFRSCLFQNLPDDSGSREGDAMAIISDDPDTPGASSANVIDCRFIGIGQGVHTRFAYVRVEGCYFTGHHGDNDDVDLWGESEPPPLIVGNVFEYPEDDDAINPTKCSAVIIGNIIRGTNDHGVVLRGECSPIMVNNIVSDCASGGIAIENSCEALLVNNTVYDCGRGLRLFDLGRWGPPYRLEPGGGTATVINCIIWDCPSPVTLADSSNTEIEDRGSHITVMHSIIDGGQGGISVSGAESTVTWGDGNMSDDPRFEDAANDDFRLRAGSPAIDAGTTDGAPSDDLAGRARPCGNGVDLGALESGSCGEGPPEFRRGEANGDGATNISDAVAILLYLFGGGPAPGCAKSADVDDSGDIDLTDATRVLSWLFRQGAPPAAPFSACGVDPTEDDLTCEGFIGC